MRELSLSRHGAPGSRLGLGVEWRFVEIEASQEYADMHSVITAYNCSQPSKAEAGRAFQGL